MAAVMRGLEAEAYDRQYNDKELMGRIWHYFQPHKRKIWIIVISVFVLSGASAAVPIIVSSGVNVMADGADDSLIPLLIGVVVAIGVGVWLLNWVRRQLSTEVIADMILAIRTDSFAASARKDLSFYDEFSTGRIVSRITGDTQEFG